MKHNKYVAADVHSATTSFTVRNADGRVTMRSIVETKACNLVTFIKAIPGKVNLTFEEGTHAAWLYDLLRPYVAELIVCNPRKNKLIAAGDKYDRIDADKLSELLRGGFLSPVYHGEHGTRNLKQLVRGYWRLVQDSVRVKNQLKAVFRSRGISTAGSEIYDIANMPEWLSKLNGKGVRKRTEWLYRRLENLEELRAEAKKDMEDESQRHRACKLLGTVPGIGPIRAAQIVAVVDTPYRFRTKRQLWKYSGLAVVTKSSNDYEIVKGKIRRKKKRGITRGLNRDFNRLLKDVFKGAAVDASTRGGLKEYFKGLVGSGMKPEMARLTVARKIAAICLAIWKKGKKYDPEKALRKTN